MVIPCKFHWGCLSRSWDIVVTIYDGTNGRTDNTAGQPTNIIPSPFADIVRWRRYRPNNETNIETTIGQSTSSTFIAIISEETGQFAIRKPALSVFSHHFSWQFPPLQRHGMKSWNDIHKSRTRQSGTADFASSRVRIYSTLFVDKRNFTPHIKSCMSPISENMTSSTKPEVHNVLHITGGPSHGHG